MKTRLILIVATILLLAGAAVYVVTLSQKPSGLVLTNNLPVWSTQSDVVVENVPVTGKTYKVADKFDISSKARVRLQELPAGWKITEDSGSGDEATLYKIEDSEKNVLTASTAKHATGAFSTLYSSADNCTRWVAERYTSDSILEQYSGALKGSVKAGEYKTFVVITEKGDGVEMGRVDVSYKDKDGNDRYRIYMSRCSDTNIITVSLTGKDEKSVQEMAKMTLSKLVLRGVI